MTIKHVSLTLGIFGMLFALPTQAMWSRMRPKLPKLINIGLSAGPFLVAEYNLLTGNHLGCEPVEGDVSKKAQVFVHDQLTKAGVKNAHQIIIKKMYMPVLPKDLTVAHVTGMPNTVHLSCPLGSTQTDLELELAKEHPSKLGEFQFILQHEAQHIKNHDFSKFIAALIAIPCTTHWLARGLRSVNTLYNAKPASFSRNIGAGLAKYALNIQALRTLFLNLEWRADNGVNDDPSVLRGACSFFEHVHNYTETIATKLAKSLGHEELAPFIYRMNDPFHPLPYERREAARQRLIKLEEQQEKPTKS